MWTKKLQAIPPVKAVMTPFPYSVSLHETVSRAQVMMEEHGFRHLPVVDRGKLVGVISEREARQAAAAGRRSRRPDSEILVSDATRLKAYLVDLSEPLDRVLVQMAARRIDAALVVKAGRLAGIFTVTDACRCFAQLLRSQFPGSGGNEAA
jgi:CBS domain-containing protein